MRSKFDAQLKELGEKLTLMGAMCEEAIANSAKALLSGDSELAKSSRRLILRSTGTSAI
jgi:phosphate uptake regulator, PhoU